MEMEILKDVECWVWCLQGWFRIFWYQNQFSILYRNYTEWSIAMKNIWSKLSLVWYAVCSSCSDWLIRTCIFILGPLYVIIMGTAELQAFAGWSQRVLSLEKLTMWNCWVLKIKINWNQFISYYFNWRSRLFISSISLKLKQYSWICFVLSYFDYNFNYSYGDHEIQKNTFYGQKYKRPICYSSQLDTWT